MHAPTITLILREPCIVDKHDALTLHDTSRYPSKSVLDIETSGSVWLTPDGAERVATAMLNWAQDQRLKEDK